MKAIQVSEYHVCFLALRDKGKGSVLLNQRCIYIYIIHIRIFIRENKFIYVSTHVCFDSKV